MLPVAVLRSPGPTSFWQIETSSRHSQMAVCQNLVPLVNIKIAGKWMFIPLKMVLIGIDPYPNLSTWQQAGPSVLVVAEVTQEVKSVINGRTHATKKDPTWDGIRDIRDGMQ